MKPVSAFALTFGLVTTLLPGEARGGTLDEGLSPIAGLSFNNLVETSFDNNTDPTAFGAPDLNSFIHQLAPFVEQQAFRLSSGFNAGLGGEVFEALMFLEISAFADSSSLDLCSSSGGCSSLFVGSDRPGDFATSSFSLTDEHVLRHESTGGTWYSDAALNADGLDHFVAFRVTTPGTINITPTQIDGTGALVMNLLVGDLLIGIEDLPGVAGSDRDFNDLMFRVRLTAVPEPASMALLGLGLLGAAGIRRRGRSVQ